MARRRREKKCKRLPDELMFKIFVLLPVVSLFRCKAVCKTWFSIISDPLFIGTHCNESKKRQPCSVIEVAEDQLCVDDHETKTLIQLPERFRGMLRFITCCDGLACIADSDYDVIHLWNPMTRRFKTLPSPRIQIDYFFNQLMLGFGFDDVSNDYKIVRLVFKLLDLPFARIVNGDDDCFIAEAEMYSVNEDSWKVIKVPKELQKFRFNRGQGVGVFRPDQTRVLYFEGLSKLLAFDLHDEGFRVHEYPKPVEFDPMSSPDIPIMYNLLEFEGSVAMIFNESSGDGETALCLWTLLDGDCGNGSWTKQFHFEDHIKNDHVILHLGDGVFVVEEYYGNVGESRFYYHKKEHAKNYLRTSLARRLTSVVKYTESLVSLKGFEQVDI